jgi:hypothetical protein
LLHTTLEDHRSTLFRILNQITDLMHDYLYPMISDVKAFIDIFMAKPATFPEQRLRLGLRHAIGLPDLSHRDQREVSLDPSAHRVSPIQT